MNRTVRDPHRGTNPSTGGSRLEGRDDQGEGAILEMNPYRHPGKPNRLIRDPHLGTNPSNGGSRLGGRDDQGGGVTPKQI